MEQLECFRSEEEINLYLDNELGTVRTSEIKTHLLTCEKCASRFEISQNLKEAVKRSSESLCAPAWLRDKIIHNINEEKTPDPGTFWGFLNRLFGGRPYIPIGIAAAMVVVFMTALFYGRPQEGNMPFISNLVHEHYEYIKEASALGIESNDPEEISGWILANTGMVLTMPPENGPLIPKGACALQEDDETIGYVYFDNDEKRISLFMLQDRYDRLSGQTTMQLGDISVYCGHCTGMNYVLWKNGDVVRVLVGDMPEESLVDLAREFI